MSVLLKAHAWGAHVLLLVALAISIVAGLWQFSAWQAERDAASHTLVNAAPVPLASLMGGDSPFPGRSVGQPVTLSGTWMPEGTVYVSGRYHDRKRGYWVVTPVLIGKSAMPVVRGWSAEPKAPPPAPATVTLTGWLEPSESQGEADTDPHDDIITSVRIASMTEHVSTDLYSGFVVQKSDPGDGLLAVGPTQQPDVSAFTGLRNLLYAIQWWVFGGLAIYMWWRWCQEQLHPRAEDREQDPAGSADQGEKVPSSP